MSDVPLHHFPVRVYWEDTDAGGIVYHANYLKFAERARTEFVRSLGIRQSDLAAGGRGHAFAVARAEIDFRASARLDDLLDVESMVLAVGGASMEVTQTIRRLDDGVELVRLNARLGFISLDENKPARMPAELRRVLQDFVTERRK
jgi:acyl-CoA thioester hydrolase